MTALLVFEFKPIHLRHGRKTHKLHYGIISESVQFRWWSEEGDNNAALDEIQFWHLLILPVYCWTLTKTNKHKQKKCCLGPVCESIFNSAADSWEQPRLKNKLKRARKCSVGGIKHVCLNFQSMTVHMRKSGTPLYEHTCEWLAAAVFHLAALDTGPW